MTEGTPDWLEIPNVPLHDGRGSQQLTRPMTAQQLREFGQQLIQGIIRQVVQAVTGSFLPGGGDAVSQLTDWAFSLLGPDFLNNLLSGNQPINVGGLFGALPPELLSLIPINILGTPQAAQPMIAGSFPDAQSVSGAGLWQWDSSITHSVDGTGSMKVTADGTMKAARGAPIPVSQGQKISPSMFCKWVGYVGAGSTVQMQVIRYSGTIAAPVEVGTSALAAITPTAGSGGWTEVTGTYTVPTGQNITHIRTRIIVTSGATNGTLYFDDGTYELSSNFVDNLTTWFQLPQIGNLFGDPSSFDPSDLVPIPVLDMGNIIHQALTGVLPQGQLLEDILAALQNIPFLNVGGAGGPANIGASIFEMLNQIVGGFVGASGSGASFPDVFNLANLVSSNASLGAFSFDLLGIRNNKTLMTGMLPTSVASVPLTAIGSGASASTFGITSTTAPILWKRFEESMSLGVISWLGYGTTNISDMRVNIWKMDPTTGDVTLAHNSANIIGSVSGAVSPQYNTYELSTPIAVEVTDIYGAEIEVRTGSGTHNIAGQQHWLPSHPTVFPRRFQSVRNPGGTTPPSTIASASVNYSTTNVPFVEFAVETGPGEEFHEPQRVPFTASGSTVVPVWANFVDRIAVGPGGGGHQGATWGVYGNGGAAGVWATDTLARGTHFTGTPTVTVTLGARGLGGGGDGTSGASSTIAVTGASTLTAAGGAGATGLEGNKNGASPGDRTYQGWTYKGGLQQSTFGGDGSFPGGGGAGGNYVSFQSGGDGGASAAWLVFRQT